MMNSATPRSTLARAALLLALAVAAAATACKRDTITNSQCLNDRAQVNRPTDGKMIAFGLNPLSIYYHYREIHPTDTLFVDWDTSQTYYGLACLRFRTTDSVHIDSAGPFQLVTSGDNAAKAWQRWLGRTDSVTAGTIWGCSGDGGTYRLNADSTISFAWNNGQQYRFFGPTGIHRLLNDTVIHTTSEESARADSTHATWRLNWVRRYCGEGF